MIGRYLAFVATVVSLIAVPGPDMLYVLGRTAARGARAGCVSALGIATGYVLVTLLVASGFQIVFATWPALFDILTYVGAGYLALLALRLTFSDTGAPESLEATGSDWRAFSAGIATSALNPKGLLFYFAILPQFFAIEDGPFWRHALIYGFTTCLLCFVLYSAMALATDRGVRRFLSAPAARNQMTRAAGVLLLAAVVTLLAAERGGLPFSPRAPFTEPKRSIYSRAPRPPARPASRSDSLIRHERYGRRSSRRAEQSRNSSNS